MRYSGARGAFGLARWYLRYLYVWSTSIVSFAAYVHLYNRFEVRVGGWEGVWPLLLEASTSLQEYFILLFHIVLLTAIYFGYDVEEGFEYVRYVAGVGRPGALTLKLLIVALLASTPLVAAKVLMSVVWEPLAAKLAGEMVVHSLNLLAKLLLFSLYIASVAALATLVIRRTSYAIWGLATYFYLFENISPFQQWTPLNAPYIYFLLTSPLVPAHLAVLSYPANFAAMLLVLVALYLVYSRGEVSWK